MTRYSGTTDDKTPTRDDMIEELWDALDLIHHDRASGIHPTTLPPPPSRVMRQSVLGGLVETEQSKRATEEWRKYMEGWSAGFEEGKKCRRR